MEMSEDLENGEDLGALLLYYGRRDLYISKLIVFSTNTSLAHGLISSERLGHTVYPPVRLMRWGWKTLLVKFF